MIQSAILDFQILKMAAPTDPENMSVDDMFSLLESNKTHVVQATQKHISIEWKEYIISRINKGEGVMGDKLFKRSGENDFHEGFVGKKFKFKWVGHLYFLIYFL